MYEAMKNKSFKKGKIDTKPMNFAKNLFLMKKLQAQNCTYF
jgi:hypothetical protein